jgi:hypothetical protein
MVGLIGRVINRAGSLIDAGSAELTYQGARMIQAGGDVGYDEFVKVIDRQDGKSTTANQRPRGETKQARPKSAKDGISTTTIILGIGVLAAAYYLLAMD